MWTVSSRDWNWSPNHIAVFHNHRVPSSRAVLFCAILINEHLPSLNIFFDFRHLSSGFNLHWFCVSCLRQHHGKRTKIQSDEQYSPNNCWLTSFLQLRLVPLVVGIVKSFGCSSRDTSSRDTYITILLILLQELRLPLPGGEWLTSGSRQDSWHTSLLTHYQLIRIRSHTLQPSPQSLPIKNFSLKIIGEFGFSGQEPPVHSPCVGDPVINLFLLQTPMFPFVGLHCGSGTVTCVCNMNTNELLYYFARTTITNATNWVAKATEVFSTSGDASEIKVSVVRFPPGPLALACGWLPSCSPPMVILCLPGFCVVSKFPLTRIPVRMDYDPP